MEAFAKFEHEGWQRVAGKYDSFGQARPGNSFHRCSMPPRLRETVLFLTLAVVPAMSRPRRPNGAQHRAASIFPRKWSPSHKKDFRILNFAEGDAQNLPFPDATFDRVLANFALLHLSDPERACAEAYRVLKASGKFGFTVWAPPEENPYAKMIDDAIQAHADLEIDLPTGPPHYLFSGREEFRRVLERVGFNGASMIFKLHTIRWNVPSTRYPFDAERNAGVRTAGLLARQTSEKLRAIQLAIEESVRRYAEGDSFSIPKAAYVVAVSKK